MRLPGGRAGRRRCAGVQFSWLLARAEVATAAVKVTGIIFIPGLCSLMAQQVGPESILGRLVYSEGIFGFLYMYIRRALGVHCRLVYSVFSYMLGVNDMSYLLTNYILATGKCAECRSSFDSNEAGEKGRSSFDLHEAGTDGKSSADLHDVGEEFAPWRRVVVGEDVSGPWIMHDQFLAHLH